MGALLKIGCGRYLLTIFFFLILHLTEAQVITGKVIDSTTGEPIPFASVGIVGTWKGTSTNLQGGFSLAVSDTATIKISCIGYESLTLESAKVPAQIMLKPASTKLDDIIILDKAPNPKAIVRRAFSKIPHNFSRHSFLQTFFYRHYCRDDYEYGRLIEASVDVWKQNGYRLSRSKAGERETVRISQLRRSLDKTLMAQGHEPIAVNNILQADVAAYQTPGKGTYPKFYDEVNNLKTDFDNYQFTLEGASVYDNEEVYRVLYTSNKDSIETTRGFLPAPTASGYLFITLKDFAIVKMEDIRKDGGQQIITSAYYRKNGNYYYPYHFVRESESLFPDNHRHLTRIELMAVDLQHALPVKFSETPQDKVSLSKIPYDSMFWKTNTILKTTPLEDQIIRDLGGGRSLNAQFERYRKFEWSTSEGGKNADEKFEWLRHDSKGERILYVGFFPSDSRPYLADIRNFKKLNQLFRGSIHFVLFVTENNESAWEQINTQLNLFADGITSYRIDSSSGILKEFKSEVSPAYFMLSRDGNALTPPDKHPGDPWNEYDIRAFLELQDMR